MNKQKAFIILISIFLSLAVHSQSVTPVVDGDMYSLEFNNIVFSVNASAGAKVSSYKLKGSELLVQQADLSSEVSEYLWGSVLWPAPQSEFKSGWPPPMELDDGDYTGQVIGNVMRFTSKEDMDNLDNKMQFVKDFWADSDAGTISMGYTLINKGDTEITKALWELVRVPVNGLTFWPTGPGGTWGDLADGTEEQIGHTWIDIDEESRRSLKFFADGSDGWLAHVDNKGRLYIKSFDDVNQSDFADGEAEIELWLADDYIELETIGVTADIAPEGEHHYDMTWYLVEVPDNILVEIGSAQLVAFVNDVLEGKTTNTIDVPFAQSIIYPNPASEFVKIKTETSSSLQLIITDYLGRAVMSASVSDGESLNIAHLEKGIYYYQLVDVTGEFISGSIFKK